MNKAAKIMAGLVLILIFASVAVAQEEVTDRVTVPLSKPGEPCVIDLGLVNGGISVTGYDGNEVVVEATSRLKKVSSRRSNRSGTEGMFRVPVNSSSLTVEEQNNKVSIDTESWKRTTDVVLRVPKRADMSLSCVNHGDIHVENIVGELEVNNVNGAVTLLNVTGSVNAHALNKDIKITFDDIDGEKAMSFSSMNGDIDITFPVSLKCDVKIKNDQGDVYSDFEIAQIEKPKNIVEDNRREKEGRYKVRIENAFYGSINGGGPEFHFSNFNGDIFLRKQK